MTASLKHLPLPAAFGERPDGTTWITCGRGDDAVAYMFEGPTNRDAAADLVRALNAFPAMGKALLAVRDACRDPDTDTAMPSAVGELVVAALAAMGERS
ncbi:UNVERIFIED_ORG: hypothetical protein M2438_001898 [Methylobacterium sp. SuP10 SLI 274]|uniref:hypothetical protein n=1 Tax=Methylorubrum extorquens TaxID=408 RepID=UPI0020A0598A|nr:hypothetical protein [Methylorubrum extorquens]MDF9863111.1 hypothetical protein [Methylorubrum pseudosasae]MDH6636723.1 hypothetical protein [Methylobacterium sp. SuP10 SLI 274]MDH6665900.1 hypothetical protein [Methylorubrum zatmanii]MCP1557814.1 hypothetical protein [Methylorubrum extorquens]MDF9791416.1 hypothetical protein [Methylorubrum extorquens]